MAAQQALPYITGVGQQGYNPLRGMPRPEYNPPSAQGGGSLFAPGFFDVTAFGAPGISADDIRGGIVESDPGSYDALYNEQLARWEAANSGQTGQSYAQPQPYAQPYSGTYTGSVTDQGMVGDATQRDPRPEQVANYQSQINAMLAQGEDPGGEAIGRIQSQIQALQNPPLQNPPTSAPAMQQQSPMGTLGFIPSINTLAAGGAGALSVLGESAQNQRDITNRTFDEAGNLISPLADRAMPLFDEQQALLGVLGPEAQQAAMSRVSDPLAAEQERAFLRNQAGFGGVGPSGQMFADLADMTRNRTQANIGTRLSQLGSVSSPALNALQNLTQQQLSRGQALGGIEANYGANTSNLLADLAQQISGAQQQGGLAAANTILGQGTQLAQLAQNLGTAQAGGQAFQAGQASPLAQGASTALNTYTGMGGNFNFVNPNTPTNDAFNTNPNVDFSDETAAGFNW